MRALFSALGTIAILGACGGAPPGNAPVTSASPTSAITTRVPSTTSSVLATVSSAGQDEPSSVIPIALLVESRVEDIPTADVRALVEQTLTDPKGWLGAGFTFTLDDEAPFRVVLAEGAEVDRLCRPLKTSGRVSCQNGPVVAINASRWRGAVEHWDGSLLEYRQYVINHEIGHLVGQRHPSPLCPRGGRLAAVMAQQTNSLGGCRGNGWPRPWEIELALRRPALIAPAPDWAPGPPPRNVGT